MKNHRSTIGLVMSCLIAGILGCSQPHEFRKDCDLCNQVNQHEVETALINFVFNDSTSHISEEAEIRLQEKKETLHHGFKCVECGCRGNTIVYRLWCATNETYELEVQPDRNNRFTITGIRAATFEHP